MPLYAAALRQARSLGGAGVYKWSNVIYLFTSSAAAAAAELASGWIDYLRPAFRDDVYCYEVYATDVLPPNAGPTPGTVDFAVVGVPAGQQRGTIPSNTSGDAYWPDVCLNLEMRVFSSRPDRKYLRPGLRENDFDAQGRFDNAGLAAGLNTAFSSLIAELSVRSSDNETIQSVAITKAGIRRLGRQSRFDVPPPPVG